MHLGIIGYGNITRALLSVLAQEGARPARLSLLMRSAEAVEGAQVFTDPAALIAARGARFEPATRCGVAVSATFTVSIRFEL